MVERIKTGIKNFDTLVDGGLPQNKCILLSGTPGTCKTIFGLEFLYRGASDYNESGVLITFEDTQENVIEQAKQFGWDFTDKTIAKKVTIISYPVRNLTASTAQEIIDIIKKQKAKRYVIDSTSALSLNTPAFKNISDLTPIALKRFMYTFISDLKENSNATGILISQADEERKFSRDSISEFVCDGIVHIYYESMGGAYSRSIQIRKMRQTKNDEDVYPLEVTKKGLVVHTE